MNTETGALQVLGPCTRVVAWLPGLSTIGASVVVLARAVMRTLVRASASCTSGKPDSLQVLVPVNTTVATC